MDARNSAFDFVFESLPSSNSIASTGESGFSTFLQHPHAVQFLGRHQQLFLTRSGAVDVNRGKDALVHQAAIEIDFHVAGAFELFEDDVVHAAAGVNQCGGDDGERAGFFDVARGGEETARPLQGVGVNTAGKHLAGRRRDGVIGARETRDRIEQDHDVALVLDEALRFFEHHFGDLDVALRRLIERRADHFALHGALHVRDFLGPLVNQQHDQRNLGMIRADGIRDVLQHHRLAGARRRDDQSALPFADRAQQVQHAPGEIFFRGLHLQTARGIERRQVVEEDFVARDFGILEVDGFDFDEREVALAVLRRTHLPGDGVARAQIELSNLRRRDVDVVRARQIVVLRRAEESETVRQAFQHAFGEDESVLFGLRAEDLENQFLFAHAARAGDGQIFGDLGQVGDVFLFQFCKANAHRFAFLELDLNFRPE